MKTWKRKFLKEKRTREKRGKKSEVTEGGNNGKYMKLWAVAFYRLEYITAL